LDLNALLPVIITVAIMLLVGFPVHEFSHALAAYRLGDGTAKLFGRLSLNPIVHFDPIGGSLLALTFLVSNGTFGFGWAKPTPVNPSNLEGGHRGEAIVAAAGPISNLVMAIVVALPFRYILGSPELVTQVPLIVLQVMSMFIYINLILMVFNLIPIPPLDGFKVALGILPDDLAAEYAKLDRYGILILIVVLFILPYFNINPVREIMVPASREIIGLLTGVET
jgi:Zn-dependent protease